MKYFAKVIQVLIISLIFSTTCYANVIWPAIYVADSLLNFWYIVIATIVFEGFLLIYFLKISIIKGFLISILANVFSASIGLYAMVYAMMGWHFVVDKYVAGTFNMFNNIATIFLMFGASVFFEIVFVRIIWKHKLKDTVVSLFAGNLISYTVVTIQLFFFGGWSKTF